MTDDPGGNARFLRKMIDDALAKGGGGGDNTGMEARVAKLEAVAESTNQRAGLIEQDLRSLSSEMNSNFKTTWAAIFAVALGLAGLMARGFHWI